MLVSESEPVVSFSVSFVASVALEVVAFSVAFVVLSVAFEVVAFSVAFVVLSVAFVVSSVEGSGVTMLALVPPTATSSVFL